jgi:hypothetical protein
MRNGFMDHVHDMGRRSCEASPRLGICVGWTGPGGNAWMGIFGD